MTRELIPLAALTIPIVVVPVAVVTNYLKHRRELTHKERMRAIEMGQPCRGSNHFWPCVAALGMGVVVPASSFFFAWLSNVTSYSDMSEAWPAAAITSLAGLFAGSRLIGQILRSQPSEVEWRVPAEPLPTAKPYYDPDALDTVGRRG